MANPLLIAYVVVVSATIGLLVNRSPKPEEAVPAMAGGYHAAREGEVKEPPLWLQLFRPSQPTARLLLRTALPSLPFPGSPGEKQRRNLMILWTGRAGERPQTLFQVMLPFLRPQGQIAQSPQPSGRPLPVKPEQGPTGAGQGGPAAPGPREAGKGSVPSKPPGPAKQPEGGKGEPQKPAQPPALGGGLPLVGIYHTHDWESYISEFPELKITHDRDLMRIASYDHSKKTVVNIGERLAYHLRDLGVTTVHAPYKHQELGYDYAYQSSRSTAREILKAAPSVRILLDLHRDGTMGLDDTTVIDGKRVARLRCVIGRRDDQPNWEKNLTFCDSLMARLEKSHPGLTLPTLTKEYRYNQDLLPGAILLEIGNALNRYDEAERAIRFLAEALVEMIKEGSYPQ
ncbi:MAG: stage II sporulation protein P [Bacillota bacterium]